MTTTIEERIAKLEKRLDSLVDKYMGLDPQSVELKQAEIIQRELTSLRYRALPLTPRKDALFDHIFGRN